MVEGQVARRNKRREVGRAIEAKRTRMQEAKHKEATKHLKDARIARAEDWKLGAIAPRRDLNTDPFGNYWGSLSVSRARLTVAITSEERRARSAWCGGPKFLCLKVGDRVVVTEGSFKGKIGVVDELDREYMVVGLKDSLRVSHGRPDPTTRPGDLLC